MSMERLKNLIILSAFIFLAVSSSSESTKRSIDSSDYDFDQMSYETPLDSGTSSSYASSEECRERITCYVDCKLDGVSIILSHNKRNGEFFVEGYLQDSKCNGTFTPNSTTSFLNISFGECGLKRTSIVRWNITVLPRKLILDNEAVTIPMECQYPVHNSTVSHNVSQSKVSYKHDHFTNRTEPPKPKYNITIISTNNKMSAVIQITPKVEGARAENCFITNGSQEKYNLTNEIGCPIDHRLFPGWKWNRDSSTLTATYTAFSLKNGPTNLYCNVVSCFDFSCIAKCPKEDSSHRKCKENSH
ncbi:hypothetical protein PV327_011015 [Microctonus hyperodae]|uniref:ZP domain-containing protein n=1 Tax=Microctonus hyperodae TaxID=165561 RepID=A0AA39FRD9_MICHY|nr:hypothetical protein PV327_011015 [Microctonus hyperodae]